MSTKPLIVGALVAMVVLVVLVSFATASYGSVAAGLAAFRGDDLFVGERTIRAGEVAIGKACDGELVIRNLTSVPIQLVGAQTRCSVLADADVPATIPPMETVAVPFKFRIPLSPGAFNERLTFYTSSTANQRVELVVTGVATSN